MVITSRGVLWLGSTSCEVGQGANPYSLTWYSLFRKSCLDIPSLTEWFFSHPTVVVVIFSMTFSYIFSFGLLVIVLGIA